MRFPTVFSLLLIRLVSTVCRQTAFPLSYFTYLLLFTSFLLLHIHLSPYGAIHLPTTIHSLGNNMPRCYMSPFIAFNNSSISVSVLATQNQHFPKSADSNGSLTSGDISWLSVSIIGVIHTAVGIFRSRKCWRRWTVFLY